MMADEKARRMSTEFFGQWFGFYHFDKYKGVDTGRYPEFTEQIKSSMYDEAVSFFEHIIRTNRPVSDILYADYDYLNKPLAKYYGIQADVKSDDDVELVEHVNSMNRGGVLRLGAVLTTTSAPLRTSPVKRGDWVLRRVLGTPTPPPPPDAGSLPSDPKLFGGLSVRDRLAQHKRNATCASCHTRIDPMGFPLEHFDSTGRWRQTYDDGKPIDDRGEMRDKSIIPGVHGLLTYLKTQADRLCFGPHRAGFRSGAGRQNGARRIERHHAGSCHSGGHERTVPQRCSEYAVRARRGGETPTQYGRITAEKL
jgi:hypothetical protein